MTKKINIILRLLRYSLPKFTQISILAPKNTTLKLEFKVVFYL
ncbi:hypothetical protein CLU82_0832 [Flavobacterium sp. 5]|nr:hypothetical protein CLU82_0832 [Flavobacterium sp. 5]